MKVKDMFRWLKQNRELLTDGQQKCLSNINKAWKQGVHNWQHYAPQIEQMYGKAVEGLRAAGREVPPVQPSQPKKRYIVRPV